MNGCRIVLVAVGFTLSFVAPALRAEGTPQVTSEIACTRDSECPRHPDCWFAWLPGCGCDEGRGRCDRNPQACGRAADCFRRELCSSESRCVEPGPGRRGERCNDDAHCPEWTLCLEGFCRNECVVDGDCPVGRCDGSTCKGCERDGDCPGGSVCRQGECQAVRCVRDEECRDREICRDGGCVPVACREDADCGGCELCTAAHLCASLCDEDERCRLLLTGERGAPYFVSACVETSRRCATRLDCGGQRCVGGRCIDLQRFLDRIHREAE